MDSSNIINSLWIGKELSPLELLTLHSFVGKGYTFFLWVYEPLVNQLPVGVELKDANTILPEHKIFKRKNGHSWQGFGKGSLALFADLFRFKLLILHGGWWVDMDVTCLKRFDTTAAYYFRAHHKLPMIGNIIKCPKDSVLMHKVYEIVEKKCTSTTSDWLLSNKLLNKYVRKLNLSKYIATDFSNPDDWLAIEQILYLNSLPNQQWTCIHWMNEVWRFRKINKYQVVKDSYLHRLYQKHQIEVEPIQVPLFQLLATQLKVKSKKIKDFIEETN